MAGRIREATLWAGALCGVVCLSWLAILAVTGYRPLVVTSGSMEPAIAAGDLVLVDSVPATSIRDGDVVSVRRADGVRVTHRVIRTSVRGGWTELQLQGDANPVADPQGYRATSAQRVLATIPRAGYLVAAIVTPAGLMVLVAGTVALVLLGFAGEPERHRPRRRAAVGAATVVVLLAGLAIGSYGPRAGRTAAVFTDIASMSGADASAHTVIVPDPPTCENLGGILGILGSTALHWPHVDARYEYPWRVERVDTGAVVRSGVLTPPDGTPSGQPLTLSLSVALLSLTIPGLDLRVVVTARPRGATGWVSAGSTTTAIHTVTLLVGLSLRCGTW